MINQNTFVSEIATQVNGATQVFREHQIDFCCGGNRPLAEACGEKTNLVLEALENLKPLSFEDDWNQQTDQALIEHILQRFHAKHRRDLPEVISLAMKVENVHGANPDCPHGLCAQLMAMRDEMIPHMEKEEQVLFPAILENADKDWLKNPIRVMESDHIELGNQMRKLEEITHNFQLPPEACNTWRALYLNVQILIHDLMEHVSLENNILFKRVIEVKA
jgi:regulator of cell morphogenesis and NO signaling